MRWLAWQILMPSFKKGRAPSTPQALIRFDWEEPEEAEIKRKLESCKVTEEQAEQLNMILEYHHRKVSGNG